MADAINPLEALPNPPAPQTSVEALVAEVSRLRAYNIELLADRDARDKADAARDAAFAKQYLKLKQCAREAGVDYPNAWKWHNRGELDSYVIEGTSEIMAELNDMIARRTRTGRHAKVSQRSK